MSLVSLPRKGQHMMVAHPHTGERKMSRAGQSAWIFLAAALILGGCDSILGTSNTLTPATQCLYNYTAQSSEAVEDFGQPCTKNDECAYGVCMIPGDSGNITNNVFGFCTRGCDCECVSGQECPQSVKGSDPNWSCVYPGGCFTGQSQGQWRYVMPKCGSIDDCKAIDERYTDCSKTYLKNTSESTCGQEAKVCMAIQ
jgi:hypothetical protein